MANDAKVSPAARRLSAYFRWFSLSVSLRPNLTAVRHGASAAGSDALPDQIALELGDARPECGTCLTDALDQELTGAKRDNGTHVRQVWPAPRLAGPEVIGPRPSRAGLGLHAFAMTS